MSGTVASEQKPKPEPQPAKATTRGDVVLDPAAPGTSAILVRGPRSRAYLTWYTILTIATTSVWGAVLGILLPNQVLSLIHI